MMRALFIASSGMQAQQLNIDVIANNLANVNTIGFKKSRVDFQSLLYQTIRPAVASESGFFNPNGLEVGCGVRAACTINDFSQGNPQETENPLDLCIEGRGFFMVELPGGRVGYTRGGTFRIDSRGYLVNSSGYPLLSSKGNTNAEGSLQVEGKQMKYIKPDTDTNTVSISLDGIVSTEKVGADNAAAPVIELATFPNPAALESVGGTTYVANEVCGKAVVGSPADPGMGFLRSGFLESSNVKIVEELVKMIIAQRAYEINSKSIQTSDDIMGLTNNLKR
ncbi:MAG: flagellar basal-body rod protein FlgG [Peptococcaceae bacterium]|nr:flagellar basal-body rod protein FlgG [Peptococcaceae bacterium]